MKASLGLKAVSLLLLVCCVLTGGVAHASKRVPTAVSPGDGRQMLEVEASCPTFSWGPLPGALAYELVVYGVGAEGESALSGAPALRQVVPGAALSWTPPLDRCLERGEAYAWVVRALGKNRPGAWSSPLAFKVSVSPVQQELEDALTVLRRYLAEAGVRDASDETSAPEQRAPGVDRRLPRTTASISLTTTSGPPPPPPPSNVFFVDGTGSVWGESFTGRGDGLTGVDANTLRGKSVENFSDVTHFHYTEKKDCTGPEGLESSCTAGPCYTPVTGGGCAGAQVGCTEKVVVLKSAPSATSGSWDCEVACFDNTGTVTAQGSVFCSGYSSLPWW